ncbi:HD domain-containing protein [Enterocloster clostridioformis]|uniref:Putative HD-superfamily hydrolase n=1 Tax=Enterocloster clostridioformis TaxID=1531 RepID=A0A2X2UPI9_9FIRM|nr:HD domain-containing protein [Enterocloster clostridioformis]MCA5576594.1 hydrolase [Enterocloster clostridioformis]SQB14893.1 putative HD-superfamily hydrolase [Enterocloster clostridioformis]
MGKYSPEEMKKAFIMILAAVERPGITDLLGWLETTDFYTAPASTKYHGAYKGGLLEHSLNVYERLLKLAAGYDLDSIAIVGLLHDLCKAEFYKESTRNQKDEQGKWQQVPCYTFNDQFPAGHGEKSVMLIMRFIRLTDEEIMAINWHMGGFDIRAHGYGLQEAWGKYPLAVMAHIADLEATWLDETGVKK